jgi:O-antigen/teichoic acid export membrane protein
LLGAGVPLVAAFLLIPWIMRLFGNERFGYISLFWTLIGTFSIFDLGISRALTHIVAKGTPSSLSATVPSLLLITLALGLLGSGCLLLLGNTYVEAAGHADSSLASELKSSIPWIAGAIPLATVGGALRGILEGQHRFAWVNFVKVTLGVLGFAALFASPYIAPGLVGVAVVMFGIRLLMLVMLLNALSGIQAVTLRRLQLKELPRVFAFGGWVTISNVLSPVLLYLDRLILGAMVVPLALTAYAIAFEVSSRLMFIPGAIAGVLFAVISADHAPRVLRRDIRASYRILLPIFIIPCIVGIAFAHTLLALWVDRDVAEVASPLLQILLVGVIANGLGHIPFAFIQARGHPDITAKFHIIEAVAYVPALIVLAQIYGVMGAAIAWSARVAVDATFLFAAARRLALRAD